MRNVMNCWWLLSVSSLLLGASAMHADAAQGKPLLLEDDFVYRTTEQTPYNHASNIVQLPNGDLLVCWGTGEGEFMRNLQAVISRRTAASREWTPPEVVGKTGEENAGNPVLFVDPKGRTWLFFNRRPEQSDQYWRPQRPFPHQKSYIVCRVSEDNGRTWGAEQVVTREPGSQLRCPPIVLTNGDWVLPIHDERDMTTLMLISSDQGKTWTPSQKMIIPRGGALTPDNPYYREGCIEPAVLQRGDGTVVCYMRYMWGERKYPPIMWESTSKDNGRTWAAPEQDDFFNPNSGIAFLRLKSGNWLLAFNDSSSDRRPLMIALSTDEGRTWAIEAPLKYGMGTYSYPSLTQTRDGLIHMTYSFSRYDPQTKGDKPAGIRHAVFSQEFIRKRGWPLTPTD